MNFYLERARRELESALLGISLEQLRRKPAGKWSAAEILEHLSLTFAGTAKLMDRCLQSGKPLARPGSIRESIARIVVVQFSHMPQGRESPEPVRPRGAAAEDAVQVIFEKLEGMEDAIKQCVQKFGAKVRLANHPFLGPLNATEWSKFHYVHVRHHMKQIARIRRQTH
jgi:hypothetical protein